MAAGAVYDDQPNNEDVISLEDFFCRLDAQGTLDTTHVLQYLSWKRAALSEEVMEICKFLRSVESGGGSSDGRAYFALQYAKSLGGRANYLPKTIETCWRKISKVRVNIPCNVSCNVQHNVS